MLEWKPKVSARDLFENPAFSLADQEIASIVVATISLAVRSTCESKAVRPRGQRAARRCVLPGRLRVSAHKKQGCQTTYVDGCSFLWRFGLPACQLV